MAERARLESVCTGNTVPRVRIPPSPFIAYKCKLNNEEIDMQKPEWIKLLVIAVIVLITSAVWLFLEIADEVLEGETDSFDTRILLAMRESDDRSDPLGPKWFEEMQRDITALGGIPVLTLFTVLCIGGMFISGHRRTAYFIFFAVAGGALFALSLKSGFDRPRPDLVTHETQIYSRSFPSGHAMISTVTYLTIGLLLAGSYKHKLLGGVHYSTTCAPGVLINS